MALASRHADALPVSYYTDSSLLSSGKWVKVKVSSTGMQEITFDRLRALGFSDPSKVAVYGYSGVDLGNYDFSTSKPDDLPAVPVANYGDKLVFYGIGSEVAVEYAMSTTYNYKVTLRRNLNNDCSYYFLTDSQPRLEVASSDTQASATLKVVETAHGLVWHNFTDRKPSSIGAYLFGENIAESGDKTYSVYLPGYDPAASDVPSISYAVAVKALSGNVKFKMKGTSGLISRQISVQGYGNDPGHLAYRYQSSTSHFAGLAKQPDDMYDLIVDPSGSGAPLTEASLDFYAFSYPRTLDASLLPQQLLSFTSLQTGQAVRLANTTATTRLWDVSGSVPREMTVKSIDAAGNMGFVSDRRVNMTQAIAGMQAIVFDPARQLAQVEVVGEVAAQNYHGMDVPEMLVVASGKTYDKALELAAMHREKTGVEVAVVPFLDICNEFASGLPHPMAIRRLAKMLYDRDPAKFKALLIFARAFSDNTGLTATETPEEFAATYIPMLECDDPSGAGEQPKAYATDMIYGMLADNFKYDYLVEKGHFLRSPLDIKVGRIPAANAGEADDYLSKARRYLDNLTDKPIYNRAIMTADWGDENLHFNQAKKMREVMAEVAPQAMLDMHIQSLYDPMGKSNESMRRRIRQQLQRGVGIWLFLGHSLTCTEIGTNRLWSNAYDKDLYNENPPFAVYGTCQTQVMDSPAKSLQVDMLFNRNGGMIAGVGSTRPVYAQYNVHVTNMMARGYYAQKPGATFGDVYMTGRNLYVNSPETLQSGITGHNGIAVNTMCYNFAGDPMLPMRLPENKLKITSFNGVVPDGGLIAVNPMEQCDIEGEVITSSGKIDTSFSGELTITVYDGSHTVNSSSTADANNPALSIDLDEDILQELKITVRNGRFSGKIAFAVPTYPGNAANRVSLYAVTDDLRRSATGYLSGLKISQSVPSQTEYPAPVISSMYASEDDFPSNSCLPGDFMLYASVEPGELGLLGNSDRMGGGVSLILDDSRKLAGVDGYLEISPDGYATLEYPVSGLSDGTHKLTLKVANIAGVSAEKSIEVNVVNVADAKTVIEEPFARQGAVIDIRHNLSDIPVGRIVVTDASGKTVFSKDNVSFPFTWDLTASDGSEVTDGVYSASVYFKAGRRHGFASPASIVVGR